MVKMILFVVVMFASVLPSPVASVGRSPRYGTLSTSGNYNSQERQAGLNVAMLGVAWDRYEPSPGVFDQTYVQQQIAKLNAFRAAGFLVVLDPGLQYPPLWVFGLDSNTHFVNQYGDVWDSQQPGQRGANAVFDPAVRQAQAAYIIRMGQDFGPAAFYAIRAGGLNYGELRYPDYCALNCAHVNSYWAFDANAQAGSPVPGWIPGTGAQAQAQAFLNYYLDALAGYQNWELAQFRAAFSGWLQVLYPSWGLRPGFIDAEVAALLAGTTGPARNGLFSQGLDWTRQVGSISTPRTMAYTTWLDRQDDALTPQGEAPVRFLAGLALERGIPVAGENTGNNTLADMQRCFGFVSSLGLMGMMWMNEAQLVSGTSPTLADYGSLIAAGQSPGPR